MLTLLIATGESDKCRPLTERIPSPMLPVLNRPVVAYAIELLARQQQRRINISLYEQAAAVEAYLGSGQRWGVRLIYHLQNQAWGDAGALHRAFPAPQDTILVLPADILIDLDLEQVLQFHQAQGAALTQVSCLDGERREMAGVYLVEPKILPLIPPRTKFSMQQVLPLLPPHEVAEFTWMGYWNSLADVSRYCSAPFELLQAAEKAAGHTPGEPDTPPASGTLRNLNVEGHRISPGIWVGRNNTIHPSARLAAPVYLHENNQVGQEVTLGPRVVLEKNVIIDQEATLQEAIVLANTYVGRLMQIEQRIVHQDLLIHTHSGESVHIRDQQFLAEVHPDLNQHILKRAFDILLALLVLILCSPLLALCAIVLLLSGKPVLTRHLRWHTLRASGQGSPRAFELLGFTTRNPDGKLTRIGSLLEALELDRLPEWMNVLLGDCSAVGVKPLTTAENSWLTEEWHRQRFSVQTGITGLWYLHTSPDSSLDDVLINDVYYAATRSGRGDLRILLETPPAWLRKAMTGTRFAPSANGKA